MSGFGSLHIKLGLDSVEFQQGLTKVEQAAIKFSRQTQKHLADVKAGIEKLNKASDLAERFTKIGLLGIPLKTKSL